MKIFAFALPFLLSACAGLQPAPQPERTLLFSDDFDGDALDRAKWHVETDDFWVNEEQQVYVDELATIAVRDGILTLRPHYRPDAEKSARRTADFVSGRINTRGIFAMRYGRAEARIRLTDHVGVWPAFWLLAEGTWPQHGEIDIMEYVGMKQWTSSAVHGPGYSGANPIGERHDFPAGQDVTDWHLYAVEWRPDGFEFSVDGRVHLEISRREVKDRGPWRFDGPQYVILNFAVGGGYPKGINGIVNPYPGVPQATVDAIKRGEPKMDVDWVRVWKAE